MSERHLDHLALGNKRQMLGRLRTVLSDQGPRGLLATISARLMRRRARCSGLCADLVRDRPGLEIGGPSGLFSRQGALPLYPFVGRLDNCNFAAATVWEGRVTEGLTFQFDPDRPPGRQYLLEATDLNPIPSSEYDFVLSSHTLEHTANPLKALEEWLRVLKLDGTLVLVVPHKDGTFDHRRPVTRLEHLMNDWRRGTTEADLTHLPEILALHDLARDPLAGDREAFRARSERNLENRCLHHHVFDTRLAVEIAHHFGLHILAVEPAWPFHIILIARKPPSAVTSENDAFRAPAGEIYRRSPFRTDRLRSV